MVPVGVDHISTYHVEGLAVVRLLPLYQYQESWAMT
jgi:hypothetical protein